MMKHLGDWLRSALGIDTSLAAIEDRLASHDHADFVSAILELEEWVTVKNGVIAQLRGDLAALEVQLHAIEATLSHTVVIK